MYLHMYLLNIWTIYFYTTIHSYYTYTLLYSTLYTYTYIYRAQEEYNHTQKKLRDETDELRDTTYHLSDIKYVYLLSVRIYVIYV